jgi:hypothetical protein
MPTTTFNRNISLTFIWVFSICQFIEKHLLEFYRRISYSLKNKSEYDSLLTFILEYFRGMFTFNIERLSKQRRIHLVYIEENYLKLEKNY